jgi:creatinine amidohydrolase
MVIWCFGATEQHGVHLPLSVDTIQVVEVARRVAERKDVLLLPPMVYGCSSQHGRRFPGTLSLRPQTLINIVEDVCSWLYSAGVRKILFLNGHFGNTPALLAGVANVQDALPRDLQLKVYGWTEDPAIEELMMRDVDRGRKYVHAGWGETAAMLAARPDLVRMEHAVDEPDHYTYFDYAHEQVTRTGAVGGNITGATAHDGEEMFALATEIVSELVEGMLQEVPPVGF